MQSYQINHLRTKDQLWLMHSITVNDISNRECLRYQLLSYFANPLKEETKSNREKCESNFEKNIFDDIVSKGYRVIPQYSAANYRIDLVVQGEKSKLAVECDGDHWHTSVEDRERDFLRERVLQRAGWTFWRVLGSTYYNNPKKALESLWEKIEELGIRPYIEWNEVLLDAKAPETPEKRDIPIADIEVEKVDTEITIPDEAIELVMEEDAVPVLEEAVETSIHTQELITELEVPILKPPAKKETVNKTDKEIYVPMNYYDYTVSLMNSNTLQTSTEINPEYNHYKKLLRSEGFEVLQDQPPSNTLYVVGTQSIHKELKYISPKNNSFSFHKNGLPISDEQPVWSISFDYIEQENTVSNTTEATELIEPIEPIEPIEEKNPFSSDSPEAMLKDLKKAGYRIIDNRSLTETVWLVGGDELTPVVEEFKKHRVIFRYLETGHSLTSYQPTWVAKMKLLKKTK